MKLVRYNHAEIDYIHFEEKERLTRSGETTDLKKMIRFESRPDAFRLKCIADTTSILRSMRGTPCHFVQSDLNSYEGLDRISIPVTDLLQDYGSDALNFYECFLGPVETNHRWTDYGLDGTGRFLARFYEFLQLHTDENDIKPDFEAVTAELKTSMISAMTSHRYHVACARLMEMIKQLRKARAGALGITKGEGEELLVLAAPIMPLAAQDLWALYGHKGLIYKESYPS